MLRLGEAGVLIALLEEVYQSDSNVEGPALVNVHYKTKFFPLKCQDFIWPAIMNRCNSAKRLIPPHHLPDCRNTEGLAYWKRKR